MVIQHNLAALNAHRYLGINNSMTSGNLEKLSSGYRINRAADDAAGLAISEKMRGQIRGLAMAEQNTSNGISLIKTAEGGLNETHDILHRMRELAVQASNGTYVDADREQIELEMQALKSEIDRISGSTHYNGIKLLDGSIGGVRGEMIEGATIGTGVYKDGSFGAVANYLSGTFGFDIGQAANGEIAGESKIETFLADIQNTKNGVATLIFTHAAAGQRIALQIGDKVYLGQYIDNTAGTTAIDIEKQNGDADITVAAGEAVYVFCDADGKAVATMTNHPAAGANVSSEFIKNINGVIANIALDSDGNADLVEATTTVADTQELMDPEHALRRAVFSTEDSKLVFQIGANGGADQRVGLHVDNMSTAFLGDGRSFLIDTSVKTRDLANQAVDIIDGAVKQVSAQRASLGALQNRMEHTLNNLGVTKENLTAAESTIRDVDMAKEMMDFTKNNILVQASQAMLAQANQLPQGVLSLLR